MSRFCSLPLVLMARKPNRFAQIAAHQIEAGGRTVRVRHSAIRDGCDANYLRESVQDFVRNWAVEVDGRTRWSQYAALKHRGLADIRFR
jgi:hypothetical protein